MNSVPVISSYVHHGDKCFFVSTIERDSSAMLSYAMRYNETMVWPYNYEKRERLEGFIAQEEDTKGSIQKHNEICGQLHTLGFIPEPADD